jgi:hypothetical protein
VATNLRADPELMREGAAGLAVMADALASAAALVQRVAVGAEPAGVGASPTADRLATGLGRDAIELALVADGVRRDADALAAHERCLEQRLAALDQRGGPVDRRVR